MPVTSKNPKYTEREDDWKICRTFHSGEKAVKKAGTTYLPRPTGQSAADYDNYRQRAFFFNGMKLTAEGLAGVIIRKAPNMEVPARISAYMDAIDKEGKNGIRAFSKMCLDEQFICGRFGLLVDREAQDNGRPYFAMYKAEDIINWRTDENGNYTLVVLREYAMRPVEGDDFEVKKDEQFRVLRLGDDGYYFQQVFWKDEATKKNGAARNAGEPETIVPTNKGAKLDYIPFVMCNVSNNDPDPQLPPLLDLARKNAEHYRVGADYANSLYFVGNPFIFVKGADMNEVERIVLGSSKAVGIGSENADIKMIESHGHGVSPNRDRYEDIRLEMALMGTRLLEPSKKGVETAQAVLLKRTGEVCVLTQMVVAHTTAIRKALAILNWWEGGDLEEENQFQLSMDFADVTLDANTITALTAAVTSGLMSFETFYYNLARGELTSDGWTAEDEKEAIEAGLPVPPPTEEELAAAAAATAGPARRSAYEE